jgi:hypothetical protein
MLTITEKRKLLAGALCAAVAFYVGFVLPFAL